MKDIEHQQTIKYSGSYKGIGLHSGKISTVTFKPAKENTGIIFRRVDLPGKPEIPADMKHVISLDRGTNIGIKEATVATIEHALAAIKGLKIDNIIVEVDGEEIPVADGSAIEYIKVLQKCKIVEQEVERRYLVINKPLSFSVPERDVDVVVVPSDSLKVTFFIDFAHYNLKPQYTSMVSLEDEFVEGFASARTFCFVHEILELKKAGLIKGGTLDNAIVVGDPNIDEERMEELRELFDYEGKLELNEDNLLNRKPLRYYNEPVRHKVVDLIGDLALLGISVKGHILAARSGHKTNIELIKKIKKLYENEILQAKYQKKTLKDVVFDNEAIRRILPHRYPLLLVDKITEFVPGEKIIGIKNVTSNEPFFQGHFPDHPVMPGVLIIEAMAQTGGILVLNEFDNPEDYVAYFVTIDKVKFRKIVVPGDQLRFNMKLKKSRAGISQIEGKAYVGDKVVCEGVLKAKISKKKNE
ncbi:MAG: bifunctional UDP-3-O-[3-hydroxymyristoyl] N-acetylglucosamine deacetylase/3-hydroxyacyl-ACP dehydratase [Candidatus Cloacimonetes bacterium]|nr:bifunctional UDP-3-O-[3-hydroxymyristoyl] N-acetylglucosamine deacetylase/3-hydroxyacyl-ACP dehydratase [Candidatus Cloacimonadota bacterium]MBS3768045.1 bifunctional UDP-3-O-[3-hydroxymyristoyl] N-acetylglucosamine deacetylase/3-hydroxyacyl-ACP dehydratase [Candidatus Cloacimonadota bacterium]